MILIGKSKETSPEREALRQAQAAVSASEKALAASEQARKRGEAWEELLVAEMAASVEQDEDAARALAASFTAGEQQSTAAAPPSATTMLQAQLDRTCAAVAILRDDEKRAEQRLIEARDAHARAVDAVVAGEMSNKFEDAKRLWAELEALCARLVVHWAADVRTYGELHEFLKARDRLFRHDHPVFVTESAVQRAWRKALATDPSAKRDLAAGKALQKREEEEQARREEEHRLRIEADRREAVEKRQAAAEKNRKAAEAASGWN